MGFMDEKLWKILEDKVLEEDKDLSSDLKLENKYLAAVQEVWQRTKEMVL